MKIAVANWKMYKTIKEAEDYLAAFLPLLEKNRNTEVYLAVPATAIQNVSRKAFSSGVYTGGQNISTEERGAFTGELSAEMVREAGASFVLAGHSERRALFGETNEMVNKKIQRALENGLQPILCVGETLQEREAGQTEEVLAVQLIECLSGFEPSTVAKMIIAYEPRWAIGTGRIATPQQIRHVHTLLRRELAEGWGAACAKQIPILYGGSVTAANAKDFAAIEEVGGVLVGGASLDPTAFATIIKAFG